MSGFSLLWSKILDSSLWVMGSKETRLVWIALMAMKDSSGRIQASVVGLADRAKVSLDECMESLEILKSPDPYDTSKVEEGRRIREIPGGWEIINHDLYRFSTEAKREFWRAQKAAQRGQEKAEREAFEKGRNSEYKRRIKKVSKAGAKLGAGQAINDGMKQAMENGGEQQ